MDRLTSKLRWLLLFTTSTCLLCCALPILLVSLGFGAVMASMASNIPFLITLSEHKEWTFVISGVFLAVAAFVIFRPGRVCPTDPVLAELCENSYLWNRRVFFLSLVIWIIGLLAAYVLPLIDFG